MLLTLLLLYGSEKLEFHRNETKQTNVAGTPALAQMEHASRRHIIGM